VAVDLKSQVMTSVHRRRDPKAGCDPSTEVVALTYVVSPVRLQELRRRCLTLCRLQGYEKRRSFRADLGEYDVRESKCRCRRHPSRMTDNCRSVTVLV